VNTTNEDKLDNGSKDVVQEKGEQKEKPMLYIKVFAHGTDQTYCVKEGRIPVSAFTVEHTHAERLDGSPVRLIKDPSFQSFRVLTFS
jgi:hypothetical protein